MIDDARHARLSEAVPCRIVFVAAALGRVVVDGVDRSGTPFAIDALLPWSAWGVAAFGALDRWAVQGCEIEVAFRDGPNGPQARLQHGATRVLLDLRSCRDLPTPAAIVA
jgi:hypothetical protein